MVELKPIIIKEESTVPTSGDIVGATQGKEAIITRPANSTIRRVTVGLKPLTSLNIGNTKRPQWITLTFSNGEERTSKVSGTTYSQENDHFELDPNEGILTAFFWANSISVWGMQFQTTAGRLSPIFGTPDPSFGDTDFGRDIRLIVQKHSVDSTQELGNALVIGRFNTILSGDNFGIQPFWFPSNIETRQTTTGNRHGGGGGRPFNDLLRIRNPLLYSLAKITLWPGYVRDDKKRPSVGAIQCHWQNGDSPDLESGDIHGNTGHGEPQDIDLRLGDRINAIDGISGRADDEIDQIEFRIRTEEGKYVHTKALGGNGGARFTDVAPVLDSASAVGMCLLGFEGMSAGRLHRLQPIWISNPPVSYRVIVSEIHWPDAVPLAEVPIEFSDRSRVPNKGAHPLTHHYRLEKTLTVERSLTLGESVTTTFGFSVTNTITVEPPKITGGPGFSSEYSFFADIAGTFSREDGFRQAKTVKINHEMDVRVDPGTASIATASCRRAEAVDIPWTGKIVVVFSHGQQRTLTGVQGTFSGTDYSETELSVSTEELSPTDSTPE